MLSDAHAKTLRVAESLGLKDVITIANLEKTVFSTDEGEIFAGMAQLVDLVQKSATHVDRNAVKLTVAGILTGRARLINEDLKNGIPGMDDYGRDHLEEHLPQAHPKNEKDGIAATARRVEDLHNAAEEIPTPTQQAMIKKIQEIIPGINDYYPETFAAQLHELTEELITFEAEKVAKTRWAAMDTGSIAEAIMGEEPQAYTAEQARQIIDKMKEVFGDIDANKDDSHKRMSSQPYEGM